MKKSAQAVKMEKEVVGSTVFAGQQVRDVAEFLWKSRLGPCSFRASRASRVKRVSACLF